MNSDIHGGLFDSLDSALISVENLFTGVRTEPTPKADPILLADLGGAMERLLKMASKTGMASYEEFPKTSWPPELQKLKPVAVTYVNSNADPDADGVLIVVERRRDWDSGVLILRQRKPEWLGLHMNGQIVKAGPDFGLRRLRDDGQFWHWYRRGWARTLQSGTPSGDNPSAP